jgi:PAS domain S-box-containing protein
MNRHRIKEEQKLRFKTVKSFPPQRNKSKMKSPLHILHLEDNPTDAALVQSTLKAEGITCVTTCVQNHDDFVAAIEHGGIDLILSDFSLPAFDGLSAAEVVRTKWPAIPLILVSGTLGEELAVDAIRSGAKDYVLKERLARLAPAVRRAMEDVEARAERQGLEAQGVSGDSTSNPNEAVLEWASSHPAPGHDTRSEQALPASELSYRRLFETAKEGVLILEADTGRIKDVNPFLSNLLGFSHSEMVGKTVGELSPFKDIESHQAMLERLQKDGYVRYEDLPLQTREGRQIAVEVVSNVYQAGNKRVIQCNIRDITERKRAEEQLKTSFKEVGELNTEIQTFYHTLSYELKTPLTSAREFVSIVMDGLAGPLNPTQLEYLGIAKESCDQLRLYINDLLDVTRLETGKMSIELQTLPLAALVERVVEMLAPAAAGKGVSLSCDCQPNLPAVPIDTQRILQVLTNLTINAIKFTPAGGRIWLSLSEAPADPECLQVAVRDTGRGIPKDQLDVIFDRLYQVNHNAQSVESRNGLGLGLYISQELVHLHGGRIWVESELGKGSTFSFVIPKQTMTKGAHVLIVDDDCAVRETLRLVLEEQNFEVTTAEGGTEALQLMGENTPEVVVLDLMMAGLDGPSTLKEIRMNWGLIPVIVYTGYPDSELMREAMESSPFTLLAKPCPSKRFVATVRRMGHTNGGFLKKNHERRPTTTHSIEEKNTDRRR